MEVSSVIYLYLLETLYTLTNIIEVLIFVLVVAMVIPYIARWMIASTDFEDFNTKHYSGVFNFVKKIFPVLGILILLLIVLPSREIIATLMIEEMRSGMIDTMPEPLVEIWNEKIMNIMGVENENGN